MSTMEMINLRVFHMPCCGQVLCWVNPRLPNKCPECGEEVLHKLRTTDHTLLDTPAKLIYGEETR